MQTRRRCHGAGLFAQGAVIFFVVAVAALGASLGEVASNEAAQTEQKGTGASDSRGVPFPASLVSEASHNEAGASLRVKEIPRPLGNGGGSSLPEPSEPKAHPQADGASSAAPVRDSPSLAEALLPEPSSSVAERPQPPPEPASSARAPRVSREGGSGISEESSASAATPKILGEQPVNSQGGGEGEGVGSDGLFFARLLKGPPEFRWGGPQGLWEWVAFCALLFFGGAVAASGGSGGGGLYLSLLLGFAHLPVHAAVPISKVMVFATAFTSAVIYRGTGRRGNVDEAWVNLVVPAALSGTLLGVYIHLRTPAELLLPVLLALMLLLCCRCLYTACRLYIKEESLRDVPAFDVVELPVRSAFNRPPNLSETRNDGPAAEAGESYSQGAPQPYVGRGERSWPFGTKQKPWGSCSSGGGGFPWSAGDFKESTLRSDLTLPRKSLSHFRREESHGLAAREEALADADSQQAFQRTGASTPHLACFPGDATDSGSPGRPGQPGGKLSSAEEASVSEKESLSRRQQTEGWGESENKAGAAPEAVGEEEGGAVAASRREFLPSELLGPARAAPVPLVVDLHLQDASLSDFSHITQFASAAADCDDDASARELCWCCGHVLGEAEETPLPSALRSLEEEEAPTGGPLGRPWGFLQMAWRNACRIFKSPREGSRRTQGGGQQCAASGRRCVRCLFERPSLTEAEFLAGAEDFLLREDEVPGAEGGEAAADICVGLPPQEGEPPQLSGALPSVSEEAQGGALLLSSAVDAGGLRAPRRQSPSLAALGKRVVRLWKCLQKPPPSRVAQHHLLVPLLLLTSVCSLGLREAAKAASLLAGLSVLLVAIVAAGSVQRNIARRLVGEVGREATGDASDGGGGASFSFKKVFLRGGRRFASCVRNGLCSAWGAACLATRPLRRRLRGRRGRAAEGRAARLLNPGAEEAPPGEAAPSRSWREFAAAAGAAPPQSAQAECAVEMMAVTSGRLWTQAAVAAAPKGEIPQHTQTPPHAPRRSRTFSPQGRGSAQAGGLRSSLASCAGEAEEASSPLCGGSPAQRAAEEMAERLLWGPVVGFAAGLVAGVFGVGGGVVIGPLLLALKGEGAAATASCCVVYTAASTALQFFLQGRLLLLPAAALAAAAAATASAGCAASLAIRRVCLGRKSVEAFAVAGALCTGTAVAARAYLRGGFVG